MDKNHFIGDYAYSAFEGFDAKREYPIKFFEDIMEVPVKKTNVVIACIEDTVKYFDMLGINYPPPLNIPEELREFTMRKYGVMTMGEFKKETTLPIFVKPHDRLKHFPAGVITKQSSRETFFNDIDNDFKVLVSEVLDIVSEYRGFVRRGKLVGLKHYIGDFDVFPDVSKIYQAIDHYKSAPVGYTIDFGVTSDNETVLIECNDGFSIGSYGLDSEIYKGILMDRWIQLVT